MQKTSENLTHIPDITALSEERRGVLKRGLTEYFEAAIKEKLGASLSDDANRLRGIYFAYLEAIKNEQYFKPVDYKYLNSGEPEQRSGSAGCIYDYVKDHIKKLPPLMKALEKVREKENLKKTSSELTTLQRLLAIMEGRGGKEVAVKN